MKLGIELCERAGFNQVGRKLVPFFLRTIAPLYGIRVAQGSGFPDPGGKPLMENLNHWHGVIPIANRFIAHQILQVYSIVDQR